MIFNKKNLGLGFLRSPNLNITTGNRYFPEKIDFFFHKKIKDLEGQNSAVAFSDGRILTLRDVYFLGKNQFFFRKMRFPVVILGLGDLRTPHSMRERQ